MRGGAGLGDAMYVRVVAEHFVRKGRDVTVATPYPDVFEGAGVRTIPFTRDGIEVIAHYSDRRAQKTSQFRDMCIKARITEEVPLSFEWTPKNYVLLEEVKAIAGDRQILLVHGGREPFGRDDGLGLDLLPNEETFRAVLGELYDFCTVGIGDGKRQFYKPECEIDLIGKTSVTDLLDLGKICDGLVAQCSFCVPLAECFDKPFFSVWASKGLYRPSPRWRDSTTVSPAKILTKPSSRYFVIDNEPEEKIKETVIAFRRLVRGS